MIIYLFNELISSIYNNLKNNKYSYNEDLINENLENF